MLRRVISFLLLLFFTSCELFSPQTNTSNNNLQVLDSVIDYTRVDVYPIFSDCENYAETDNQKKCFETSLIEKLSTLLNENKFEVKQIVNDTTLIDVLIDNTGKAAVVKINSPTTLVRELPKLDSIIKSSIDKLPTMKPAVKRGIFVKSQYRLSIVVQTDK